MKNNKEFEQNINIILGIMNQETNLIQAPKSEEILEILKIMYDEEDAAVGAKMNSIPESPDVIAERLSMTKEELIPVLEKMADRGLVLRVGEEGQYMYSLFGTDIGIFETAFGKGSDDEKTRELAKLWTRYYNEVWGDSFFNTKTNIGRIVPIQESLPKEQEVLPYEKVSEIIEAATYLTVTHCACKSSRILSGEGCSLNAPTETCMFFEDLGRHFAERGFAREITKEEAYDIIKSAEDLGMVHFTVNSKKENITLCSCCPCCCVALGGITKMNKPDAVASTNYFSSIDWKICNGCEDRGGPICVERCPIEAISIENNRALVKASKCLGCGICKHFCPVEGAVTLKKRKKISEPKEDLTDLMTCIINERKAG